MLNSQHSNLCFTCEEASGPSLPFLDAELTICDGEFNVSVYLKPTFTDVFLHLTVWHLCHGNEALLLAYYMVLMCILQMIRY